MEYVLMIIIPIMAGLAVGCWFESRKNEKLQKEIEQLLRMERETSLYYNELETNSRELRDLRKRVAKQEQIVKKLFEESKDVVEDISYQEEEPGTKHYSTDETKKNMFYQEEKNEDNRQLIGNRFVDYILEKKRIEAEQKGIVFEMNGEKLSHFPCSEMDTITLLDNMLENALESCERVGQHQESVEKRIPFIRITFCEKSLDKKQRGLISFVDKLEKDVVQEGVFYTREFHNS